MTKLSIDTRMRLTDDGKIGATAFILAPIASGIIYPFLMSAIVASRLGVHGSTDKLALLSIAMVVSVGAFLGGFVMFFLGRRYEHQVEIHRE